MALLAPFCPSKASWCKQQKQQQQQYQSKSTKCYKSASDRPRLCQNMQWKTTHNVFFSRAFNNAENTMFVCTIFVMSKKRGTKKYTQRIPDYARWLTAKKFCLHCEFSTFFSGLYLYMCAYSIWCRMHNIVFLCTQCTSYHHNSHTYTQFNCIFIICCAFLMLLLLIFFIANTKYHKTCWMFDDFVYHVRSWYMENQKKEKNTNLVAFLYDYDNWQQQQQRDDKKEHCRKIYWLGRQV